MSTHCRRHLSVAVLAISTLVLPACTGPVRAAKVPSFATLYGADGTVPPASTSERSGVRPQAIANWSFPAGQAAWVTDIAGDGTRAGDAVFTAEYPQTNNPAQQTADHAQMSVYSPSTGRRQDLDIPTYDIAGDRLVSEHPAGLRAEVDWLARYDSGPFHGMSFISSIPSGGMSGTWNVDERGVYPTLGFFNGGGASWSVSSHYTANQIAASAATNPALVNAACPADHRTKSSATTTINECRQPSAVKQLLSVPPSISPPLVIAQYSAAECSNSGSCQQLPNAGSTPDVTSDSGGVMIVSPYGRLLAAWDYPRLMTARDNRQICVRPREVDVDPTSDQSHERFTLISDVFDHPANGVPNGCVAYPGKSSGEEPFIAQEFSFNEQTNVLAPISSPTVSGITEGFTNLQFSAQTAHYDVFGDLWIAQSIPTDPPHSGGIEVWGGRGSAGTLGANPDCRHRPNGPEIELATVVVCPPTNLGSTPGESGINPNVDHATCVAGANHNFGQVLSIATATNRSLSISGDVVITSNTGCVALIRPPGPGRRHWSLTPGGGQSDNGFYLNLNSLTPGANGGLQPAQGELDQATGHLWQPLAQLKASPAAQPQALPQFLYDIDVSAL